MMVSSAKKNFIIDKLKKDNKLPSLPHVVIKLLRVLDDPKSEVQDLVRLLQTEASLVTQLLKLVNSAFYGFSSSITTIDRAVTMLGYNSVKTLVLGLSIVSTFDQTGIDRFRKEMWRHSLQVAVLSRIIARNISGLKSEELDEIFILGLLHDIGKMMMYSIFGETYTGFVKNLSDGSMEISMEEGVFGFNHAEAGEVLCGYWNLPAKIRDTVRMHHDPKISLDDHSEELEIRIIAFCNMLAKKCYPIKRTDIPPGLSETGYILAILSYDKEIHGASSDFHITVESLASLCVQARKEFNDVASVFNVR